MGCQKTKVLLAESRPATMLTLRASLERRGCECRTVGSVREVRAQLAGGSFALAISSIRLSDGGVSQMIPLFEGSSCTAFFVLPVEEGCLWIPAVDHGKDCYGSGVLSPRDFVNVLENILKNCRADNCPTSGSDHQDGMLAGGGQPNSPR
jgi:DNA-binding NtrC family response regulator